MRRPIFRLLGVVVALTIAVALLAPEASAVTARHCVVTVVGHHADGELVLGAPRCYHTAADARHAAAASTARTSTTTSFIIGIHYDGAGWTGASTTVIGNDCAGGWLNVSPAWNDRISSTYNGCPRIRHYQHANLTGVSETTTGAGGNLSVLDNQTTSIQYLT